MRTNLMRSLQRYQTTFGDFTPGQKVIAVLGTLALLLASVLVFRWIAKPEYAPLYSNLSASDASAVVDKLDSSGIGYQLTNGGNTVMVPKDEVYKTRITLSGEGLPTNSTGGGYSLLDNQGLSTSQFQEQTDFKRAMEGELDKTIQAMDGVTAAVVHLALPEKQVFSEKQGTPTASVLIATRPGVTLSPDQVQAVVHLVAASIEGMKPEDVTVADSTGKLLSTTDSAGGALASSRQQYVDNYQSQQESRIQNMLDRVLGPGNSHIDITADLNFDQAQIQSKTYRKADKNGLTLSTQKDSEVYKGPASGAGTTGVVGPDGQMGTSSSSNGASQYDKKSQTDDNALDTTVETRQVAPGNINALHVAVAIDSLAAGTNNPQAIQQMVASALGIKPSRGDTLQVSVLPFDRTGEKAAAAELKAQQAADAKTAKMSMYRNIGIGGAAFLALLFAWFRGRKKNQARTDATNYVIEQLRSSEARDERALENPATQLLSLEGPPRTPEDEMRDELAALVERQPEDVATLLRGWLVER